MVEHQIRMNTIKVVLLPLAVVPDPSEECVRRLAEQGVALVIARSATVEALLDAGRDADIIVGGDGLRLVTAEVMDALPSCWAIVKTGSGVDMVDIPAATQRGILVSNTPQAVTESVSDHTIAMLFAAVRKIRHQDRLVRQGIWSFAAVKPGRHFRGATVGLVGYGRIARAVQRKLSGFEMRFLVYDPYVAPEVIAQSGAEFVELDDLLRRSDFVCLHCPLTGETRHMIGERQLRMMKREAVLANMARGAIVDEAALYRALKERWIAGAALDVLEKEPPDPDNPLFALDNVVLSPHLASISDLFPDNVWDAVYDTLVDLAHHRWPESVVNRDVKLRWELS